MVGYKQKVVEEFLKSLPPIPGFEVTPFTTGIALKGKWGRILSVLKIDYEKDTVTPDQTVGFETLDDMEETGKALVFFAMGGKSVEELLRYITKVRGRG